MRFVRQVLGFILGFVVVLIFLFWSERFLPVASGLPWFQVMTGLLMALYLSVVLHELGHVLTGAARGFRFLSFQAGLLNIESGRLYLKVNRTGVGGQVMMLPPAQARVTDWIVYFLGGPLANLLTVPLAGWAAWHSSGFLALCFSLLAQFSVLMALLNLWPGRGGLTDGAKIKGLLPRAPSREMTAAVLNLQSYVLRCVPPPKWPHEPIHTLRQSTHQQPIMELTAVSLLTCVDSWDDIHEDNLRSDLQRYQAMGTSIQQLPKVYGQVWHASIGGIKAALNDLDGARHEYDLANRKEMQVVAPLSLAALRCSLLYAGGHHEEARLEAEKALECPARPGAQFTAYSLRYFLETKLSGVQQAEASQNMLNDTISLNPQ